jgi:ketosteroid isomerase-like protein
MPDAPADVIRRYLALFEQGDPQRFEDVLAPDLKAYSPDGTLAFDGRDAWIASHAALKVQFEHVTEEALLVDGDRVACRYRAEATFPDGRRVASTGTKIYRLTGGLISEIHGNDHTSVE